jgi:O-antigen/teichoic acid export membrane protein
LGAAATLLFNLLLLPLVLDRLGPDLYGSWIALSALIAVGSLADAGVRTEVARRVADAKGAQDETALARTVHVGTTVMVLTAVPVAVLGLVLAPLLSQAVFPDGVPGYPASEITMVLRVMILAMAANLVLGAHFAALRGVQRSDVETIAQVAALPANAVILVAGVVSGWGLWALLAAQVAGMVVVVLVQGVGTRILLPGLRLRLARASWGVVLSYLSLSTLALVSQVSDVFDSQWDKLVIARFVAADAVTSFHIGTMLGLQAKAVALLPLVPLLAAVSELRVSRGGEAHQLQRSLMKAGAVASAVILGSTFVFAPAFIDLWLGAGYGQAGVVARIFVVALALNLISAPFAFQAFAEGAHRVAATSALTNMVVNAVASLMLTIHIGLYGAVIGSVIGNLLGTTVLLVLARRRLSVWVRPPVLAPLIAVVLTGLMVLTGLDSITSWAVLVAAAALFASLLGAACARAEGVPLGEMLRALGGRRG